MHVCEQRRSVHTVSVDMEEDLVAATASTWRSDAQERNERWNGRRARSLAGMCARLEQSVEVAAHRARARRYGSEVATRPWVEAMGGTRDEGARNIHNEAEWGTLHLFGGGNKPEMLEHLLLSYLNAYVSRIFRLI